jgi:hypothetical protein
MMKGLRLVLNVCLIIVLIVCLWVFALRQEVEHLRKVKTKQTTEFPVYTIPV